MDRRQFLTSGVLMASGSLAAAADPLPVGADQTIRQEPVYPPQEQYRIGYTTNTRGGWEGDLSRA